MKPRELFVVVPDLDTENAIRTLLCKRQSALKINLNFTPAGDLLRYSGRDSGCCKNAVAVLNGPRQTHRRALLIFDQHGCGMEGKTREEIETEVEGRLHKNGWAVDAVCVVVIQPEIEAWVWAGSANVAAALGWGGDFNALQSFLIDSCLWERGRPKPRDPKEAMRRALREKNKPSGAAIFSELAERVSLERCEDPAFQKLRRQLQTWFPVAVQITLQSDPVPRQFR